MPLRPAGPSLIQGHHLNQKLLAQTVSAKILTSELHIHHHLNQSFLVQNVSSMLTSELHIHIHHHLNQSFLVQNCKLIILSSEVHIHHHLNQSFLVQNCKLIILSSEVHIHHHLNQSFHPIDWIVLERNKDMLDDLFGVFQWLDIGLEII
jgi:hypothetical protein